MKLSLRNLVLGAIVLSGMSLSATSHALSRHRPDAGLDIKNDSSKSVRILSDTYCVNANEDFIVPPHTHMKRYWEGRSSGGCGKHDKLAKIRIEGNSFRLEFRAASKYVFGLGYGNEHFRAHTTQVDRTGQVTEVDHYMDGDENHMVVLQIRD